MNATKLVFWLGFPIVFTAYYLLPPAYSQEFDRIVIDGSFPGAYQVEVADVNGDTKPDIVAVGGGTCAWYENPTWKKRIVTDSKDTPGIISSASADIDGDGRAEIAIAYEFGMNSPTKGKLVLATQGHGLNDPWTTRFLGDIGSIHRLRWGNANGADGRDLIIAPLFGPAAKPPDYQQAPATILRVALNRTGPEKQLDFQALSARLVLHAIEVIDANHDGQADILTADNEGVQLVCRKPGDGTHAQPMWQSIPLIAGFPGSAPKRGCSEIHLGQANGKRYLATVEPWHGTEVVVNTESDPASLKFGPRSVIDNTLADGHALWIADVDGDGDDEILAGHRGKDHRVSLYDFDRHKETWTKTVIDSDIAAQDLRGADLNGDGTPDVVAVGGATHNVVWYRFRRK